MKHLFTEDEIGIPAPSPIHGRHQTRQDLAAQENPSWLWRVYAALMGEERPRPMFMWLTILAALLHVLLAQKLLTPQAPLTQAKPLKMEVTLMTAAAPQQAKTVTPPTPKPVPPKPKKPKPIKQPPRPLLKKPVEPPKKVVTQALKTPVAKAQEPREAVSEPVNEASPVFAPAKPAAPKVVAAPKKAEAFTEANYKANYGYNPKPVYPSIARRQRWQGRVLLRVQVSADGTSDAVRIQQSSGHEELDEAAIAAVQQWRFIPAKRGDTPVSSSVLVPINFTLKN